MDDFPFRIQHPFAEETDADLEGPDVRDLVTCRQLLVLATVLILAFWGAYRLTDATYVDPLWGRFVFALVPASMAVSSYVVPTILRRMVTLWRLFLYGTVGWFTGLSALNDFAPAYGLGMLFIVGVTSAGFGVGLRERRPLVLYLTWATLLPSGALLVVEEPGIGRWILPFALFSLSVIFYLILNWRIRAEEALRESRRQAAAASRLKSTIIGAFNHEIRTPLTSIMGFSEMLSNELSGVHREQAEIIQQSGARLRRTLDTLLALSRLQADRAQLRPESVDVAVHVETALEPFVERAEEKGLQLEVEVPESGTEVHVSPEAIERIVAVLTDNAIKFTETGTVEVRVSTDGDWLVIVVRDTGIGIPDEAQSVLFEPFRQASEGFDRTNEGLGVGLALVGQLVELMDGCVEVESQPGEGTRVTVSVPRDQDDEQEAQRARAKEEEGETTTT